MATTKKAATTKTVTTKAEIIAAIASAAEITKVQAEKGYEEFLAVIYKSARSEKGVVVPGLGRLFKGKRAARKARNPQTGATIKIPACTVAKFRLAKAAKDGVLNKK